MSLKTKENCFKGKGYIVDKNIGHLQELSICAIVCLPCIITVRGKDFQAHFTAEHKEVCIKRLRPISEALIQLVSGSTLYKRHAGQNSQHQTVLLLLLLQRALGLNGKLIQNIVQHWK